MIEYYLVKFVLESKGYNTLWFSGDSDGFLVDLTGSKILVVPDQAAAQEAACGHGGSLQEEITSVNCDMLLYSTINKLDCDPVLTFWNIISDVAASLDISFLGDNNDARIQHLYDKLFFGCNLPAIRDKGPKYMPIWNKNEVRLLQCVIDSGLDIVKKYIRGY